MTDNEKRLADAAGAFVVALMRVIKDRDAPIAPFGASRGDAGEEGSVLAPDASPATYPGHPMPHMPHDDGPAGAPPDRDAMSFSEGERVMVDGAGSCSIQFIQTNGEGITRWDILNGQGQPVRKVWGRERAEKLARELHEKGTLNVRASA